jgi:hypothetical protein
MKRILLSAFAFTAVFQMNAQVVTDTVTLGAGYANQVWYSLENDDQEAAPRNEWDLAFDLSGFGTSIHANTVNGVEVYTYPLGDTADWAALDISDIANWEKQYNAEDSWSLGALDQTNGGSNQFDIGWGIYNVNTHIIYGDSIFVIKLPGGTYKKLVVTSLTSGIFYFKYADIDGSNLQEKTLIKADYPGKNFGYFSLTNNVALDREPLSADWDLLFTQYTGFVPTAYPLAGVLSNLDVTVAQVSGVSDPATYDEFYAQTYAEESNVIGGDWKSYSGSWVIQDDLVFFVSTAAGDIWKVVFTGFTGSGTGQYIFTKEKMSGAGVNELTESNFSFVTYPNPSVNGNTTLVYTLGETASAGTVSVYALSGELVYNTALETTKGIHNQTLDVSALNQGVYIVNMTFDGAVTQQRLVVQ